MIEIRRSEERGHASHGWLESKHSFSFANYHDPENMGFRALRVINEDWIDPTMGFGTHPHSDMEIVTYVVSGALGHRDSMGNGSVLRAGDVQRMTAGRGIRHSEVNPSHDETLHLLQIWILPEKTGLDPSYEERNVSCEEKSGRLAVMVSGSDEGGMTIHQDVTLLAGVLKGGQSVERRLESGRHAWVQVVGGALSVNGERLEAGDAAAISEERVVQIEGLDAETDGGSEVLLFDLA